MIKKKAAITFENLNVNSINTNSGIFVGKNTQFRWDSDSKSNHGFGSFTGDENELQQNVYTIKNPTAF